MANSLRELGETINMFLNPDRDRDEVADDTTKSDPA